MSALELRWAGPRRGLRPLVILALVVACDGDKEQPPPRKVERRVDVDRIPVPNHGPEVMAGTQEKRRTVSAEGIIEAMIDGQHAEHTFLPFGMNAAIASEETGVARLTLVGSPTDAGYPALHLQFEGLRLDEVELPKTFEVVHDKAKKRPSKPAKKDVVPKILYYESERIVFETDPTREDGGFEITVESFEGKTVRGTFKGTLYPRVEHFGEPKTIDRGRFEVSLRLSGIEPAKEPGVEGAVE